jgi:hypothetical protein
MIDTGNVMTPVSVEVSIEAGNVVTEEGWRLGRTVVGIERKG